MKEKILIALSDTSLASVLSQKLNQEGYSTIVADDGEDTLKKMQSQNPDLALIDLVLSGKNGYDVLNEKTLDRFITKIPVIVISNSGMPIEMRKLPSTPTIKDYIVKAHVEPMDVVEKVSAIFNHPYNPHTDENKTIKLKVGKKILWVEDDKFLTSILVKKFQLAGHNVRHAENGDEAISMLKEEIPDIILLDIFLSGMNGFDILQKIKMDEKTRKIPIIMLSNTSKESDIVKAKTLGANKFLVKAAVSLDEIIKEVDLLTKT
jgi:CheY-like chemotaxis protein